jgi:hypothetical protein
VAGTRTHDRDLGGNGRVSRILLLDAGEHRHILTSRWRYLPPTPARQAARSIFNTGKLEVYMDDRDRRLRRGLIGFQIFIYGLLVAMFLIQLQMYLTRDW